MKAIKLLSIIVVAITISCCNDTAAKKDDKPANEKGFAVVELFTSEGCSSCPPADEAMIKLAKEFPDHVYFLAYHVDYWDYIGWKDEFDDPEYTKRQNNYAQAFGLESIYTPQSIINGKKELVGSREGELRTIIQQELRASPSDDIQLSANKENGNSIIITYKLSPSDSSVLNIVLVQLKATTRVGRGENKGLQLNHINIVRAFRTVSLNKNSNGSIHLAMPNGLDSRDVKVIAFLQNEKDMKISGGGEANVR